MSSLCVQSGRIALMLAGLAPMLAGCKEPAATAAPSPPEAEVAVVIVQPQARAQVRELPGRVAPTRVAEVRPRVSGIIVERLFHQGSEVKAGDPLYRIDPRPFEVEVQSTEAALARARAAKGTYVVVIDTDPMPTTQEGGAWWDVAVPEVSPRGEVKQLLRPEATENVSLTKERKRFRLVHARRA